MNDGTRVPRRLLIAAAVLLGATPAQAHAQGFFDRFSYEGLSLQGIGAELGAVFSNRLTREASPALRLDLGFIAPYIRVLVGGGYFKGEFNADEIGRFEAGLRRVVTDPTGDFTIDVQNISWSNIELNLDLQFASATGIIRPYVGLGLAAFIRDGDGVAIDGTFVEDALDTAAAGVTVSLGTQIAVARHLHVVLDTRGSATSELRTLSVRGGLMYRVGAGATR